MNTILIVWIAAILSLTPTTTADVFDATKAFRLEMKASKVPSPALLATSNIPRGGGALLDPELAAKLFIGTYGLNALACGFAADQACGAYGLKSNAANQWIMQKVASVGMNTSLLLYLQKFNGMAFGEALGWSVWPFVLMCVYTSLIAKSDGAVNVPGEKHIPSGVLNVLVFLASTTKASWASGVNKVYGFWSLLWAPLMLFFSEFSSKLWSITLKDDSSDFVYRNIGFFLLGHGLAVILQTGEGVDLMKTIGWVSASNAAGLVYLLVTGKVQKSGVKMGPTLLWTAFLAYLAASLLS